MNPPLNLHDGITSFIANFEGLKATRNIYLNKIKEVLDIYLFSVMEDEDALYKMLHQRPEDIFKEPYHDFKITSPYHLQMNVLISLPFERSGISVEDGGEGFVKIKLPLDFEESVKCERLWRDACSSGLQKSLLRNLLSWTDENGYLKQAKVLNWFSKLVERSLALTGEIPNYDIKILPTNGKLVMQLNDLRLKNDFEITLLPVIGVPIHLLPEKYTAALPQGSTCSQVWMAECRSNPVSDCLWGISLWQHERQIIKRMGKTMIHVLKGLRDSQGWLNVSNYHIRTLVILEYQKNPESFRAKTAPELLLDLLLRLRDMLVSRDGLPFIWDNRCNLLCGLTGPIRSGLAQSVTSVRKSLADSAIQPVDVGIFFKIEMYGQDLPNLQPSDQPYSETSQNQVPEANQRQSQQSSGTQSTSQPQPRPRHEFRSAADSANNPSGLAQNSNSTMWWAAGAAGVGIAALLIGSFATKRNNK